MTKIIEKIHKLFDAEGKKRNYYIAYTFFFLILSFFVFSWYIFSGRTLIWQEDGWTQHFKALLYYADYLRQILRNLLFNHQLVIPDWDFYIGEGSDIINALHYYVIGDPIALFSVFIPTQHMAFFYSFSCILRLYLSGIAFSVLAFGIGHNNRYGIMAGALSYSFCLWTLLNVARHPYFLNPMIYFPLLILGIEKIIRKERPYMFIISVAISAASNFYFFYMIVILAIIYALIRLGFLYQKDFKNAIITLLRMGIMAIIGVCIAGIILLPVLMMFLQDSRLSVPQPFHWFYPLQYYSQLPSIVVSNNDSYWLCMGFSAPVILSIFLLFIQKKENRVLKVLFMLCIIIMLFPIGGRILNGMSYMTNRWSWVLALLCSYILVKEWDNLISISNPHWKKAFICSIVFYVICLLFDKSRSAATFSAIPLLFISLFVVKDDSKNKKGVWKQELLILIVAVCAMNVSFWQFSPSEGNYIAECKEYRTIQFELSHTEAVAIKELSDETYPRYTGRFISKNINMIKHVSSTQYYWSISNPYMNRFRSDLEMREPQFYNYQGYDDRTTATTLSAVQYYVTRIYNNKLIPYGFLLVDSPKARNYFVYKNQYALPLGYCYNSYITQETWNTLDAVQKQEIQLESAYVNEIPDGISKYSGSTSDYSVPFDTSCAGDDITQTKTGFITTSSNAGAVLSFEGLKNAETYICFEGFEFTKTPEYDLYFGDESVDPRNLYDQTQWEKLPRDKQSKIRREKTFWNYVNSVTLTIESSAETKKELYYIPSDASFSSGRHDFIVNLGYFEEPITSVTITFPNRGIYTIENLQVYCIPMDQYAEKVSLLQENTLQNIKFGTDTVTGELDIDTPQLLCMAIPYSSGWTAYVDGEKTQTIVTNDRYLGISVPAGSHLIEFHYSTPYKHVGFIVSLMGMLALVVTIIFTEKKRRIHT